MLEKSSGNVMVNNHREKVPVGNFEVCLCELLIISISLRVEVVGWVLGLVDLPGEPSLGLEVEVRLVLLDQIVNIRF